METKICNTCRVEKELIEFYKRKRVIEGICKKCACERSKKMENLMIHSIIKDLGNTKRQYIIWHDGAEWITVGITAVADFETLSCPAAMK